MKHNFVTKINIFIFIILSAFLVNKNVYAESNLKCDNSDSLLNYFNFKFNFDSDNDIVKISVKNGSFIVTEVADGVDLFGDGYVPEKQTGSYEGINFDYYKIGSNTILSSSSPFTFKVRNDNSGTIKLNFAFFTDSNKEKDSKSGCSSYDYYLKNKDSNASVKSFETKNGDKYVEIVIPDKRVKLKENTNYNTYCKAIRDGENYNNAFDKKVIDLWRSNNSNETTAYYQSLIGDCWNQQVSYVYNKDSIVKIISSAIKSWNSKKYISDTGLGKDESWSINFNNVKEAARSSGNYFENGASSISSKNFSLKCNYVSSGKGFNLDYRKRDSSGNVLYDSKGNIVYNIDANVNNYYASSKSSQSVTYTYHYTSGKVSTTKKDVCSTLCEEAVEVKYGPPVASKAGLCFEYQVQVTSRVKCSATINDDAGPDKPNVCNPVPYCNSIPGYVHQGGPSNEFDSCINKCDGGKYTKKCSEKCFKSVYEDNSSLTKTNNSFADYSLTKLANTSIFDPNNGKYVWNNHKIYWRSKNGGDAVGYARYYLENEYNRTFNDDENNNGNYRHDGNGFKRYIYFSGLCTDPCYFTGCKENTYLNSDEAEEDYVRNTEIYEKAVSKCQLSASCTEKTAKFNINVKYKQQKDGSVVTKVIKYNESSLVSDDSDSCNNPVVPAEENILLNYQGCYKKCGTGQQYHARWSFPGTWFNLKTGEISYTKKPSSSWFKYDKKFCSPLYAMSTNTKWWNYYVSNFVIGTSNVSSSEYDEYLKCNNGNNNSNKVTNVSESDIEDWNINASTTKFGYYGWNFNIKCFYSLPSNKCDNYDNYSVKSVDTSNLFPDPNGTKLNDASNTGSVPSFNWSDSSITYKNPGYVIDPPKLITSIQSQSMSGNDAIYSDANLDYEFNLSSSDIANLRKVTRKVGFSYNNFNDGKYLLPGTGANNADNGVSRYQSNVITKYATRRPNDKAIKCNNIKDSSNSSGECNNYNN